MFDKRKQKRLTQDRIDEPDRFKDLTDEQLFEFVKAEGAKDASVLAKLIVIQRIRKSLLRERMTLRIMTSLAIVVGVFGLVVALSGYFSFQSFLDDRAERTATACRDNAEAARQHNTGLEEQVDTLYFLEALVVDPQEDPDEATFLTAQIDIQVKGIRENYRGVRDCTTAGIRVYNESKGELGYLDGPQISQSQRRAPINPTEVSLNA